MHPWKVLYNCLLRLSGEFSESELWSWNWLHCENLTRAHSEESLSLTTFSGNLRTDWAGEVDCPWGLSQLHSPPQADELARQCWPLITLSNRVRQDPEPDSWLWGHNFQGFRAPAASRPWEHAESTYHAPAYKEVCALRFAFRSHVWACVLPSTEKHQYLQERVLDLHPDSHPFFLRQNNIPIPLGWEISPVNFSKENMWHWLVKHPPARPPSIFCILLSFYLDSPTVHILSAPATQHIFLSSKILFHFACSAWDSPHGKCRFANQDQKQWLDA